MAKQKTSFFVRFWNKVLKAGPDECWLWTGYMMKSGFGQLNKGRIEGADYAHRISYEIHFGEIPSNMNVIHKCKNRLCVNPNHLFLDKSKSVNSVVPLKERLLEKRFIENETGCWLWTGYLNHLGYGKIGTGPRGSKILYVHRASWEIFKGPIPKELFVLHKCDVPRCFNPDHLFLGTQKQNIEDCIAKGRFKGTDNLMNG